MGTAEDGESIPQLLCAHSQDGTTLAAALFQKDSASWLVIGAVEQATSTLRGPAYVVSGPEGAAHIFLFREYGSGQLRLLTPSTPWIRAAAPLRRGGVPGGQPAHLGVAGGGDILEEGSRAAQEYEEFWQTYLPAVPPPVWSCSPGKRPPAPTGLSRPLDLSPLRLLLVFPGWTCPTGCMSRPGLAGGLAQEGLQSLADGGPPPPPGRSVPSPPPMAATCCPPPAASEEADYLLIAQADSDPECASLPACASDTGPGKYLRP